MVFWDFKSNVSFLTSQFSASNCPQLQLISPFIPMLLIILEQSFQNTGMHLNRREHSLIFKFINEVSDEIPQGI